LAGESEDGFISNKSMSFTIVRAIYLLFDNPEWADVARSAHQTAGGPENNLLYENRLCSNTSKKW
jgi:hypothetical protein